jgi:hypothetical protein
MRTGRRRAAATVGVVLGIALLAGFVAAVVAAVVGHHASSFAGPVYTVAQVQVGLQQHPIAWAGRTVGVRGMAAGVAFGSTYELYMCGIRPGACRASVPAHTVAHLLLVPNGVDAGVTNVGMSEAGQKLTYYTSATNSVPGVAILVQPQRPNSLLTVLRRIPLIGSLVPNEGQGSFQRSGIYWVHIPTKRTCDIAAQLCDDAVLLAAPQ